MSWRFHAQDILNRTWIHRDLPLTGATLTDTLSGPGALTGTIPPGALAPDELEALAEWGTLIVAEQEGRVRGGGILTSAEEEDTGALSLTCTGISAYPDGQPLMSDLVWGGANAQGRSGHGVDPAQVVTALWEHLQALPDGNLGVHTVAAATPYRLGSWYNAAKQPTEQDPNPDPGEAEDEIPIDRVWDPAVDSKPAPAKGKRVHWSYGLHWHDNITIGDTLDQLCKQVPMDYREHYTWEGPDKQRVRLGIEYGHPRLGARRPSLRLALGENLLEPPETVRDADEYANTVVALGAGEGSKQPRHTAARRDGRLRRATVIERGDTTRTAALKAAANEELERARHTLDITRLVLDATHPNAPAGSFAPGDDVLVRARTLARETELWVRVLSTTLDVDTAALTVECARSDSFTYQGGTAHG